MYLLQLFQTSFKETCCRFTVTKFSRATAYGTENMNSNDTTINSFIFVCLFIIF